MPALTQKLGEHESGTERGVAIVTAVIGIEQESDPWLHMADGLPRLRHSLPDKQ